MDSNNTNYAKKMNDAVTVAMKQWWEGLSKEEILAYLADQPAVTADALRKMLANTEAVLGFDIKFSTVSNAAVTTFHTEEAK